MRYQIYNLKTSRYTNDPDDFDYKIDFRAIGGGGMVSFHQVRKWLSEIYGWSDIQSNPSYSTHNEYWTWRVKMDEYLIYLKSDKELMFFKLRFTNNDLE